MLIFYPKKKDVYHKTALPLKKKSLEAIKEKKIQRTPQFPKGKRSQSK